MGDLRRISSALAGVLATTIALALLPAAAAALPPGFSDHIVHRGLKAPTSIAIAPADPDAGPRAPTGVRFVAEKDGKIKMYDGADDPTPTLVADLSEKVMSAYDRGLEAIALDPGYPERPYLYASYTYNAKVDGAYPLWQDPGGGTAEGRCKPGEPDPGIEDGCEVSGRLAQLTLNRQGVVTAENVIVEDWCQQFTSHSMGGIVFDRSGALLVGGGEGASFNSVDIGDQGTPPNVCGDPPGQGGALRAQDLVTPRDPLALSGTVIRVDPDTGEPMPGNPSGAPGNAGRIVAYGLRNPFRLAIRPGTDELWIADVGWGGSEEINATPLNKRSNFGWPCFEGSEAQLNYAEMETDICGALYSRKVAVTPPWFSYRHGEPAVPGDTCFPYEGALSGLAFDSSEDFPLPYDGALFASDYVRGCIWTFLAGRNGSPRQDAGSTFVPDAPIPVDLVSASDGLYYADIWGGTVRRITYDGPTVEVRAVSRPRGAKITLGGRDLAGSALTLKKDTSYRVAAPRHLIKGSRTLRFHRWTDGGRRIHRINPSRDMKLRAVYRKR